MLSDRPYMRGDYEREKTSILTWLISALIAGFVVQLLLGSGWIGAGDRIDEFLGLTPHALEKGWVWTLLSHAFLHSPGFIVHVIFNVLALYFLGRELLPMLGAPRFLGIFAAATLIGGLAWSAVHWNSPDEMHMGRPPPSMRCSSSSRAFFRINRSRSCCSSFFQSR